MCWKWEDEGDRSCVSAKGNLARKKVGWGEAMSLPCCEMMSLWGSSRTGRNPDAAAKREQNALDRVKCFFLVS